MSAIVDFFRNNLFWIIFFLAIAIIFYIYTKLDASTKLAFRRFFSGKVMMTTVVIVLWVIWYYRGGESTFKTANFWMPLVSLILVAGYNFIGGLRYETQQIQCANGFHGSYSKPPRRINGFLIFAIDSFNAGGLSWDYAGKILVLREETVEFCDEGAISIARPVALSTWAYELEEPIKAEIENNRFLKGRNKQIFFGYFDDLNRVDYTYEQLFKLEQERREDGIMTMIKKEFDVSNPKVSTLFWAYKNQNKATNKQTENFDATVESVEKGIEHQKRIKDAYIDKGQSPNEMKTGGEEY